MNTKTSLTIVILIMAGVTARGADRSPNIVILLADDLGWTGVGCFGSDLHETPNIDRLAAEGMKFSDAYSACTVCSPTRASIMTGKYPARIHLTDFIAGQNRPFEKLRIPEWTKYMRLEEVTIAEALKAAGYATAHVGKWHLEPRQPPAGYAVDQFKPTAHGFDVSIGRPTGTRGFFLPPDFERTDGSKGGYLTDYLTDEAVATIERFKDGPFFLYLAYFTPHTPIQGKEDLVEYYTKKLQGESDARHRNPTYAAMIHSLDESVGRVAATLEELGLSRDTLIVFTSDNGGLTQRYGKIDGIADNYPLRRGKGSAYEGGVRVPMIARWPGVIQPGSQCAEPVMTTDLYPTALDVAGASGNARHNARVDGVSLVKLLHDPCAKLDRNALYWHYPHYHAGGDAPYSAVRSGDWRLIEFHDDTPAGLYNLSTDIEERNNLAATRPDKLKELSTKLHAWRETVGAQMPSKNPDFDPARAGKPAPRRRKR
ncbi:MAG: sulfatase [Planctomycetes bacterium]|nr:sulfatase [Planctomycetota bacterium]MBL7041069.1 sulfatase [Pirellulaceae bacterium]